MFSLQRTEAGIGFRNKELKAGQARKCAGSRTSNIQYSVYPVLVNEYWAFGA